MVIRLLVVSLLSLPVVLGFARARRQRDIDGRHLAAFVGFTAALTTTVLSLIFLTTMAIWPGPLYYHPALQIFVAICSLAAFGGMGTAFVAGLFSRGRQRLILVIFGPFMCIVLFIIGLANQGN